MIVDFKELSPSGEDFENLVFDLLKAEGFNPMRTGRGPDRGVDIIFTETINSRFAGPTNFRWIVQCKDNSRSGKSVKPGDVGSIRDLIEDNSADGFILFTTTTASVNLQATISRIETSSRRNLRASCFSGTDIANMFVRHKWIFQKYLPQSYERFTEREYEQRDWLVSVVEAQKQKVLNMPLVPWATVPSPSLDFIWPELYVNPIVRPRRHPTSTLLLKDWIKQHWFVGRNIALIGQAGIGKSTALAAIFLELANTFITGTQSILPIIVRAASPELQQARCTEEVVIEVAKAQGITPKPFPPGQRVVLFVDGLDEASPERTLTFLRKLLGRAQTSPWYIIACRKMYFHSHVLQDVDLSQTLYDILELCPWEYHSMVVEFAKKYLDKLCRPEVMNDFDKLARQNVSVKLFAKNPFHLTLLLFLLTSEDDLPTDSTKNLYGLYKSFYSIWLAKEVERGTSWLPKEEIQAIHRQLATIMFTERGEPVPVKFLSRIEVDSARGKERSLLDDTGICALLEFQEFNGEKYISRFAHETLAEFHVAEQVLLALKNGGEILNQALQAIYSYEVNVFVRGSFELLGKRERHQVYNNLLKCYIVNATSTEKDREVIYTAIQNDQELDSSSGLIDARGIESENTRIREQVLYYLGRLPVTDAVKVLHFAVSAEPLSLLRRTAAISAILHGAFNIEYSYMQSLLPGSQADVENRSIQLVYFGDVEEEEFGQFIDNGTCGWERVRQAICERLRLSGRREMRLRWWDIRTLFLFCESRGWGGQLSEDDIAAIKSCAVDVAELGPEKARIVEMEKKRILQHCAGISSLEEDKH